MTSAPPRRHHVRVRVYYGDTDQMGVAYYANYLRWFEMGRNEYLRAADYPYARLEREGVLLPVVEAGCRYLRPARYDDEIDVEAWIARRSRVRVRFEYCIRRVDASETLCEGFTVHACLDAQGSPRRLPEALEAVLDAPAP